MSFKYEELKEKHKQIENNHNNTIRELNYKTNEISQLKTSLKSRTSDLEQMQVKLDYLSNLVEKNEEDQVRVINN